MTLFSIGEPKKNLNRRKEESDMSTQSESYTSNPSVEEREEFTFPVDIYDRAEEIVLVADLPGVSSDALDVHFDRGHLAVRGRVAASAVPRECGLQEFRTGDFVRTFEVSEGIDASGISAELKDGVLTLRLPKAEERKPRKISVKAG